MTKGSFSSKFSATILWDYNTSLSIVWEPPVAGERMADKLGPHLPMTAMRSLMACSVNTIS